MSNEEFGQYLKFLRHMKGLTLTELSKQSKVSHPYLSQIENGKKGTPSPEVLKKLADPLGVEYTDLMMKAGYLVPPLVEPVTVTLDPVEDDEKGKGEFTKIPYNSELEVILLNERLKLNGHELTEDEVNRIRIVLKAMFPEKWMRRHEKKGEEQ